jgi:hypothetical protein
MQKSRCFVAPVDKKGGAGCLLAVAASIHFAHRGRRSPGSAVSARPTPRRRKARRRTQASPGGQTPGWTDSVPPVVMEAEFATTCWGIFLLSGCTHTDEQRRDVRNEQHHEKQQQEEWGDLS